MLSAKGEANPPPLFSVIIPALNAENSIDKVLRVLSQYNRDEEKVEIIVVDNGSSDRTLEIARQYHVKILSLPGVTISTLRNEGARCARGQILAFLDADCIVTKNWIAVALPYFRDFSLGALGSTVFYPPPNSTWVATTWFLDSKEIYGEARYIPSGMVLISKRVFDEVGGFDESLISNEDCDLSHRLKQRGYKVLSDPRLSVIHLGTPQTLSQFFKREVWHGRSVFGVFLRGLPKLKNLKAVSYGLFYVFSFIAIPISLVSCFSIGYYSPILFLLVLFLLAPLSLAVKTTVRTKRTGSLLKLTVIYLIYGVARAISILHLKSWVSLLKQRPPN